jgi:hypothetical protein
VKLSSDGVNWLNAGLMVAACAAAYAAPFHLFLFSYAVLGPLHYFTEISWLHDRDYFAPRVPARRWWLALVATAMAVLMYGYVANDLLHRPVSPKYEIALVYLVFATAAGLLYVRRVVGAAALVGVSLAALALFSSARAYFVLAYLLVTIVHVLVFTAAFVLHGALRLRSRSALVSLAVFLVCAVSFFVWRLPGAPPPDSLRRVYDFFAPLNLQLLALFRFDGGEIYESAGAVAVMRLIAFAYTYHYLNWFSKTSIIRWHEVPHSRAIAIIALWIGAVALYQYDYTVGLAFLYLLSLLHVLLEFPLDHQTFVGIGKELRAAVTG